MVRPKRIPIFFKNFRRHIVNAPTKGIRSLISFLRQAKICQLKMPFVVQNDIFRFHISVDNILLMKIPKGYQGFKNIKFGIFFRESSLGSKQLKKFSTRNKLHKYDIEMLGL